MATNLDQENRDLRAYLLEVKQAAARCEEENEVLRNQIHDLMGKRHNLGKDSMEKRYTNTQGTLVTLYRMIRDEPDWAASRIRVGEDLQTDFELLSASHTEAVKDIRKLSEDNARLKKALDNYRDEVGKKESMINTQADQIKKLDDDIRQMVEKAAKNYMPAYREQGEKMLKVVQQNEAMKEYLQSRGVVGSGLSNWSNWDNFVLLNPEYK